MTSFTPLFQLFDAVGEIKGKKRLQKIVHLLQECSPANFGVTFRLAQFGAFSSDLAVQLDQLNTDQFLEGRKARTTSGHPTLVYSKTPHYDKVMEEIGYEKAPWKDLAARLNGKDTRVLEAISTIVFLHRTSTNENALKQRFNTLKPHLAELFDTALQEANQLLQVA